MTQRALSHVTRGTLNLDDQKALLRWQITIFALGTLLYFLVAVSELRERLDGLVVSIVRTAPDH